MPNGNPGASSDELEERIRQPEKKMLEGNLGISSVNRNSQRICQSTARNGYSSYWNCRYAGFHDARAPAPIHANRLIHLRLNRFSRIAKASAAVRFILVGSRRSNGRSREEWSGLSESNRHLNLGKSAEKGLSRTYEALSGALSSV